MQRIWQRFCVLPFLLKIIWIFCALGLVLNFCYICRDMQHGGVLLKLHLGFFILYAGQVVFILWGERMVCILSFLQAILALLINLDFTFVPLLRLLVQPFFMMYGSLSIDQLNVYKYVFVSVCFTLEMFKTFLIGYLLPVRQ